MIISSIVTKKIWLKGLTVQINDCIQEHGGISCVFEKVKKDAGGTYMDKHHRTSLTASLAEAALLEKTVYALP